MLASAVLLTIWQNMHLLSELILLVDVEIFKVNLFFRRQSDGDWFLRRFKKIFPFVLTPTATDRNDIKTGKLFRAATSEKYFPFWTKSNRRSFGQLWRKWKTTIWNDKKKEISYFIYLDFIEGFWSNPFYHQLNHTLSI